MFSCLGLQTKIPKEITPHSFCMVVLHDHEQNAYSFPTHTMSLSYINAIVLLQELLKSNSIECIDSVCIHYLIHPWKHVRTHSMHRDSHYLPVRPYLMMIFQLMFISLTRKSYKDVCIYYYYT